MVFTKHISQHFYICRFFLDQSLVVCFSSYLSAFCTGNNLDDETYTPGSAPSLAQLLGLISFDILSPIYHFVYFNCCQNFMLYIYAWIATLNWLLHLWSCRIKQLGERFSWSKSIHGNQYEYRNQIWSSHLILGQSYCSPLGNFTTEC